jgi:hypothetical protein
VWKQRWDLWWWLLVKVKCKLVMGIVEEERSIREGEGGEY